MRFSGNLAAILDFLEIKPEGSVSQNVSGSQMNQYDMAFDCANFGTCITKCSSLLPGSPTITDLRTAAKARNY